MDFLSGLINNLNQIEWFLKHLIFETCTVKIYLFIYFSFVKSNFDNCRGSADKIFCTSWQ